MTVQDLKDFLETQDPHKEIEVSHVCIEKGEIEDTDEIRRVFLREDHLKIRRGSHGGYSLFIDVTETWDALGG